MGILREAAGDDTLGKSAGNPVIDYVGQNKAGSCWRIMGGSYAKENVSLWNEFWYMNQFLVPSTVTTCGVRVSMNLE